MSETESWFHNANSGSEKETQRQSRRPLLISDLIPPLLSLRQWPGLLDDVLTDEKMTIMVGGCKDEEISGVSFLAWLSLLELCHGHYPSTKSARKPEEVHSSTRGQFD